MPERPSHKSLALFWIQLGKLLSFGTLAPLSGHCSALFGFAINPEIPPAQQRKYFSFSQNHLQCWTAVKSLGLLYLPKINSFFLGQINKGRRNSVVWRLNTLLWTLSIKDRLNSCSSLRVSEGHQTASQSKVENARNSFLWLYSTSEATKSVFIEGGEGL